WCLVFQVVAVGRRRDGPRQFDIVAERGLRPLGRMLQAMARGESEREKLIRPQPLPLEQSDSEQHAHDKEERCRQPQAPEAGGTRRSRLSPLSCRHPQSPLLIQRSPWQVYAVRDTPGPPWSIIAGTVQIAPREGRDMSRREWILLVGVVAYGTLLRA